MYDYVVVGAGLAGAVFAREMTDKGKKCLVIDRRNHIAGNVYSKNIENIQVHMYGAHIFHTNDINVWHFLNRFTEFNSFVNSPMANFNGEFFNLPFNMNTFNKLWNITSPDDAKAKIKAQIKDFYNTNDDTPNIPTNLEEQAISLIGVDVYEKLIKGYTEKQWGKPCTELPPSIIKRLPVRFTYDNNYFNAKYQGVPVNGYTKMVENILDGIEVRLNVDYLKEKSYFDDVAKHIFYTGAIDEFFTYELGALEYRSLRFENEILNVDNYQGVACVNYTDQKTPYTRIIEHKHFNFSEPQNDKTVITKEFPTSWEMGCEPYYSVNDEKNLELYNKYVAKSQDFDNVSFGGRLGKYMYFDMDRVVADTLDIVNEIADK